MPWIELRFGISHPAWHWTSILLHVYGSDAAAIEAVPNLFAEFEAEREQGGVDGILAKQAGNMGLGTFAPRSRSSATRSPPAITRQRAIWRYSKDQLSYCREKHPCLLP